LRTLYDSGDRGSGGSGLKGKIEKTKIGSFHYQKRLKNGAVILCRVDVFPMQVLRQAKHWPEQGSA